ncbi:hypothetical protein AD945_00540 [Gluconobacter albidus]|uniref:Uncharacterized protein n=1 Tax=Gluconobacter albidus TaxID=318683 RepID=A0A149TNN8_9PROT|nr:hypothetical protein [Gluconobacter albidus]KXV51237.1 hypothetical protein AD945_00540 [Gluconobacter albidus]
MENCGLGYQNAVLSAVLSTDSAAVTLPVTNLTSPQGNPAYAWRAEATTATLTVALSQRGGVRVVSVHRTNLTAQASWRIVVSSAGNVLHDATQPMAIVAGQAVCVLPAELQCDVVAITIADPGNPDGYLSIPLAYVGPLWQPVRNFSTDSSSGFNLGVDEVTALSGAEFPQMRWIQRKASIAHQSYGVAETATLREIQRVAAVGENILFLPDPGAASQEEAIFGRLSGGDIGNPYGPADRRSWTFTQTERL